MASTITTLVCKRCGYEWVPRVPNPKVCPACKHRNWNESDWEVENEVITKKPDPSE